MKTVLNMEKIKNNERENQIEKLQLEKQVIEVPRIQPEIVRKKETNQEKQLVKLEILKKLSSGTGLREGLNDIVKGHKGALIVIINENSSNVFQGGFKVNCKFSSKRLTELAKMDGAIILSSDFRKILYANTLLVPNSSLNSNETGTRHQAAERTAKQINGLVIAVSERRGEITIYYGNSKYALQNTEDLLRRATETLQILEKQRETLNELINNMNVLEVTSLVSVGDVCNLLQRLEIIRKMSIIINEYIVELGNEGIIVRMRMKEIAKGIDKKQAFIIKDYSLKSSKVKQFFDSVSFDNLLESENIAKSLFDIPLENEIFSRGYRLLSKTSLNENQIENLVRMFKNLDGVLNADEKLLARVLKDSAEPFRKELSHLREQIMIGKKI